MEDHARVGDVELSFEFMGEGPRLVWVHGLASCRTGDRDIIDALAARFTVLSYDARGHGRSGPVREVARFSYPLLARDLLGLLELVGWDRATVAGASMGGATGARAAMLAPERVAALVMARPGAMGPGGTAPLALQLLFAGGARALRDGGIDAAIAFLFTIPEARAALEGEPARLAALRRDWTMHDTPSIAAALEGIPRTSPLEGGLRGDMVRCPTLVIPGNDPIHPTDSGIAIARMIPGAVLAPAFDSLPRSAEVAELVARIVSFLAERGVTS